MKTVDDFLNNITMYRLVYYYLIGLLVVAFLFGLLGVIPQSPFSLLFSVFFLLAVCLLTNEVFAKTFGAQTNKESAYISALILALIVNPPKSVGDLFFLFWAGVLAMSSKFIFARKYKHLFNPVAISVFLTSVVIGRTANWWVGSAAMFLPVLAGGFLVVRKIERTKMVAAFFVTSMVVTFILSLTRTSVLTSVLDKTLFHTPILFFSVIMLTEPLTTPPTKNLRILYGALVGLLFSPQFHLGSIYLTPESSLLLGNVFSYFVSFKERLVLTLKEKIRLSGDTYDFIFNKPDFSFTPGQYMEWTLGHDKSDDRGNRRYFTLASSPTENNVRIGVKFYPDSSSYKKTLLTLPVGSQIAAGQLAGDFTLPKDKSKKLVFIAGGIGITPFRSMIKYLLDTKERRDIILLYSNKEKSEIVYHFLFEQAKEKLGIKTFYTLTDKQKVPADWKGMTGRIDSQKIKELVPVFNERTFYLSGPHNMVKSFEKELSLLGVPKNKIKIDYFPGFA